MILCLQVPEIENHLNNFETPFDALHAYCKESHSERLLEVVLNLKKNKYFDLVSWDELKVYTLDDYKALHRQSGPKMHLFFHPLLGMIISLLPYHKQKKSVCSSLKVLL
jgi:hypothetical protein